MWKITIRSSSALCLLGLLGAISLGCDMKSESQSRKEVDAGRHVVPEELLPDPSPEEWTVIADRLLTRERLIKAYEMGGAGDLTVERDFWITQGKWFAGVYAARSDSLCEFYLVVGRYVAGWNYMEYRYAGVETLHVATDSALARYEDYARSDQLWMLFEAGEFWMSDSGWSTLFDKAEQHLEPGGMLRATYEYGLSDDLPQRSRRVSQAPTEKSVWELYVAFLSKQEGIFTDSERQEKEYPQTSVDFLVYYDNWFAVIASKRDSSDGVYRTIVGQHLADSIIYRYAERSVNYLEHSNLKAFERLKEHDSLWSLVGPLETWQDKAGLKRLWDEAGMRMRSENGAALYQVLRFKQSDKN